MLIKEHTIAIYGLSSSTQELLEQLDNQYHIVGLLDGYRQDGMLYGKPILSMEQAVQSGVTAIIIVARPSSRRIIVNRIRETCKEHGIKLYDVHGRDLLEPVSANKALGVASGIRQEEILEKINQSDVISFDIFDTLIMRTVLYPSDVFELVEQKLIAKYGQGFDFSRKRQEAERKLSRAGVPAINDIYKELEEQLALSAKQLNEIQELEWQVEQKVLVPRYDMCEVFRYALEKRKKVYLVSDMYYSEAQLVPMLSKLGITGYEKLLVSCDYGTAKEQGLFQVLKEDAKAESYLHIGDNYAADVKSAERNGISAVCIKSGMELFDSLYWAEEFAQCNSLAARVKLGMFVARMFNSPFALAKGNAVIKSPQDLGYLLFAPILTDFIIWLYHTLQGKKETTILFCARDGYLLKHLFDKLSGKAAASDSTMKTIYFLTSRISAVGASLFDEQDILHIAEKDFNGSLSQLLQTRFSLRKEEIAEKDLGQDVNTGVMHREAILKYQDIILERAVENRERYQRYIASLEMDDGDVVFFDFVSSGTSQAALEKIMGRKLQGYYFIRVVDNSPEKKGLSIVPFYDRAKDGNGIYEDYFILENILTSPMPSLRGFNAEDKPEYLQETRSSEQIKLIGQVHEGITEYFEQYTELLENVEHDGRCCSEKLLGLLHKVPIENDVFHSMVWDDSFFARTVTMKELM